MATPGRTQKQIAERYKGNLGYYKRKHPWRVARWCASFLAIAGGIAGILFYQKLISQKRASEEFFSTGTISSSHAVYAQDCASCHDKGAALGGDRSFSKFKAVVSDRFHHGLDFASIDRKCQHCHEKQPAMGTVKKYDLHEPNVVENRSCSVCHQEHLGPGRMKPVANLQCAACHNDRGIMEASAQKGMQLLPSAFHLRPHPPQQVVFKMPRPPRGYTQVLSSFAGDHPEFQLVREKARDPDLLRFNHQRHYAADIPPVEKGRKLDCNYCHKTDPDGRYYQRVSFEANCQACHALQFDKNNPQLHIPHGDVNLVRAFLRTLPAQYGDYARLKQGKTQESDVQSFVAQQIRKLLGQFGSSEELERAVFFEKDPYKPQRQAAPATRANYVGCALCHDVRTDRNAAPTLTKPVLVDRWMPQAKFNHAKHQIDPLTHEKLDCNKCHRALVSRDTSDVLMPAKADCVTCHSPKGKIVSECITCHTYHAPPQVAATDVHADSRRSFKQMLLGSNR
jgi:mono/diheme cytochrome c family protein